MVVTNGQQEADEKYCGTGKTQVRSADCHPRATELCEHPLTRVSFNYIYD